MKYYYVLERKFFIHPTPFKGIIFFKVTRYDKIGTDLIDDITEIHAQSNFVSQIVFFH